LPQAAHYVDGNLAMAKARGLKTAVLIGDDSAFPHAIGSVVPDLAKDAGIDIAYTEYYPHSSSDYSATVLKVKSANPDLVIAASMVPDSIGLVRQLKASNVVPKMLYMAVGGSDPAFGKDVGNEADGVLATTSWSADLKTQGNDEFIRAFKAEYGNDPEYHSAASFAGLTVVGEAVLRVKALDQEKLCDTISTLKLPTVLGTFNVDPATGKQIGYQAYVQQWQGDKQVIVYPDSQAHAKLKYPLVAWDDRH
jgi:branched-chain amino acid transport system substrate-binding protein